MLLFPVMADAAYVLRKKWAHASLRNIPEFRQ